jgi:hypothetical protein
VLLSRLLISTLSLVIATNSRILLSRSRFGRLTLSKGTQPAIRTLLNARPRAGGSPSLTTGLPSARSPRQRVYALLAMLGRAEVQVELGGRRPHTPQATEIAMRCISNGKIMQRAKDDEAQKRVEQGGW